jgi:hypothetical protein
MEDYTDSVNTALSILLVHLCIDCLFYGTEIKRVLIFLRLLISMAKICKQSLQFY